MTHAIKSKNWVPVFIVVAVLIWTLAPLASAAKGDDKSIWSDKTRSSYCPRPCCAKSSHGSFAQYHGKGSGYKESGSGRESWNCDKKSDKGSRGEHGWKGRRSKRMQQRHKQYIEWLKEEFPEEAKKLADLRGKNPEAGKEAAMHSVKKYGPIMRAQETNPALAEALEEDLELKKQRGDLLKKIRTASGKEQKELTKELKEVVAERFENIIKKKELQYQDLRKKLEKFEQKVERQEAELKKLKGKKDQAVKDRLKELLEKTEKINWD